jgi:molybdate transport system substrate-binding protein
MKIMKYALSSLLAVMACAAGPLLAQEPMVLRVVSSNLGAGIAFEFSTARTLVDRIAAGREFDVAVLTPALLDELAAMQLIDPASPRAFARVGIGVGARPDAPFMPVASLEDLRTTLLQAESVAFGADGQSRRTNEASFERLGIADTMRSKTRLTGAGEAPVLVARGEVDLVLTLISELLREPDLHYLGPLPPEVQAYIVFAAAVSVQAADPAQAAAFIEYLSGPAFASALQPYGLEPIAPPASVP